MNFDKAFHVLNFIQLVFVVVFSWLFIYKMEMKDSGYGLLITLLEILNMICLTFIWFKWGYPESIGKEKLYNVVCSRDSIDYFKFYGWCLFGNYSEYLGWEF